MTDRNRNIKAFLKGTGWADAERNPVPGDASSRRYERLSRGDEKAVLMDAPKAAEAPSEPEDASVEDRRALGYNALARLAGPNQESFAAIAKELTMRGFSAPKVLAADFEQGFVLLEDLGDDLFARVIEKDPAQERPLYEAAVDTLAAIYRSSFPRDFDEYGTPWKVRDYDAAAMQIEANLCLEWFAPDVEINLSDAAIQEWHDIWADMFTYLEGQAPGLGLYATFMPKICSGFRSETRRLVSGLLIFKTHCLLTRPMTLCPCLKMPGEMFRKILRMI